MENKLIVRLGIESLYTIITVNTIIEQLKRHLEKNQKFSPLNRMIKII